MSDSENSEVYKTVDHLFRTEAGKMVSVLIHLFGFANMEQAEDIVQDTILKALEVWKWGKVPENPRAWLYQSAKNKAIDLIRREKLKYKIENELSYLLKSEYTLAPAINELFTEGEIKDSQLRMMFASCHPGINVEAQITLILKTLCGLSVKEIANAFLVPEDTISKRLYRTKEKIRNEKISLDYPGADMMQARLEAVLKTLYLLFNEGYSSSHPEKLIRQDLCEEAIRLVVLLSENKKTNLPQTNALLALLCYQASRFDSRIDDKRYIILLKDQERSQWNKFLIQKGNEYLTLAAKGEAIHEYHLEAAIASIHANAKSYQATDWKMILNIYNSLLAITHNPVVAINRCIAIGEAENYHKAFKELSLLKDMQENFHHLTVKGEVLMKVGNASEAITAFNKALTLTSSVAETELIQRKIKSCTALLS